MAQNFDDVQVKLSEYLQSKFETLSQQQVKFEECYTKNPNNVARYIDCTKTIFPKMKAAEETFSMGLQFLGLRLDECSKKGTPNDCLKESMKIADDLVSLIDRDLR